MKMSNWRENYRPVVSTYLKKGVGFGLGPDLSKEKKHATFRFHLAYQKCKQHLQVSGKVFSSNISPKKMKMLPDKGPFHKESSSSKHDFSGDIR